MAAVRERSRYGTDGSAALARAYAPARERVRAPGAEPQIRTRERVRTRPRAVVREAGRVSIFAVTGALTAGILTVLMLLTSVQVMTTSDQTVQMKKELAALKEENVLLLARYELAYDLKAIEAQLLASGEMIRPQGGQIVVMDLSEPDSMVVYDPDAGGGILAMAVEGIAGLFGGGQE